VKDIEKPTDRIKLKNFSTSSSISGNFPTIGKVPCLDMNLLLSLYRTLFE
jgi:hypothetical protein